MQMGLLNATLIQAPHQLYIEHSPWIEQSNMSCDSYDCIKCHTLLAFCQPNVKLKE